MLLLVSSDNTASVYDLNNNKMLEDSFPFKSLKYIDGSVFTCNSYDKEYGIIYEFTDTKRNIYNYSTEKGFIFGPIPYRKVKKHAFGYVINNHLVHYFYGQEDDLNNYIKVSVNDGYEFYTDEEHYRLYIFSNEFGLEEMDSYVNSSLKIQYSAKQPCAASTRDL